jgi:hypothetical protein
MKKTAPLAKILLWGFTAALLAAVAYGPISFFWKKIRAPTEKEKESDAVVTASRVHTEADGSTVVALGPETSALAGVKAETVGHGGAPVPLGAVVRHEGRTWVYVQRAPGSFARREILLSAPGPHGARVRGIATDERIVTVGAGLLLSEELKGKISGD